MAKFKYDEFILRFTNVSYDKRKVGEAGLGDFFLGVRFGESIGLTSEVNSGADTVRDLLFGTLKADKGQIMYYGRSIDETAPTYVRENYRNLRRERARLSRLQERKREAEEALRVAGEDPSEALTEAASRANDAFLTAYFNYVQLQGGFVQLDEPDILAPYYSKRYDLALEYRDLTTEIEQADALYRDLQAERERLGGSSKRDRKLFRLAEELDDLRAESVEVQWELEEVLGLINIWKEPYLHSEEFLRHERELDEAVSLFRLTDEERRRLFRDIQYVPSIRAEIFDPGRTFAEVLQAGLIYQGLFRRGRASTRLYLGDIAESLGLERGDLARSVETATRLEAFKLLLGRSLALRPKLLYLDEPLRPLSQPDREEAYELLLRLKADKNLTLIVASQDVETLNVLTDRCAVLCEGHLVELYDTQALFAVPFHPYTASLVAAHPQNRKRKEWSRFRLRTDEGDGTAYRSSACPFRKRCLLRDERCEVKPELSMAESGHFNACHHSLYGSSPRRI